MVGSLDGLLEGWFEGSKVGLLDGRDVLNVVGKTDGCAEGSIDGRSEEWGVG